MKKLVFICALMLISCGSSNQNINPILPSGYSKILWHGKPSYSESLNSVFLETQKCMENFSYSREGEPHIIIVDSYFWCDHEYTDGCFVPQTLIYLSTAKSTTKPIYVDDIPINAYILKHEVVHWITQKIGHGTNYMNECAFETYN